MRWSRVLAVLGALGALAAFYPSRNPLDYVHWKDRIRASEPIAIAFGPPCSTRAGGIIREEFGPECYSSFKPPRKFNGVWVHEYEGSRFIENKSALPEYYSADDDWLTVDPAVFGMKLDDLYDRARNCVTQQALSVSFVGQQRFIPVDEPRYARSDIWVQKVLAAKPLSSPTCIR